VTPGDGVAHGAVACRLVAGAARQQRQAAIEARQQRRRRQDGDAGGGQLDRQRQPVQPPAEGGDGRRVVRGEGEVGPRRLGPRDEEAHRRAERLRTED
jgi:hypothetical protein